MANPAVDDSFPKRLHSWAQTLPSWWVGALLAAFFLASFAFEVRNATLGRQIEQWQFDQRPQGLIAAQCSPDRPVETASLDARSHGYSAAAARCWLSAIGAPGRSLYVRTQWTLDLLFPFVYGLLLLILLSWAGGPDFERRPWLAWALLLPFAAVACDLAENSLTTALAGIAPAPLDTSWVCVASFFTQVKFAGVGLGQLLLLIFSRRILGTLLSRLLLVRVPALGLLVICALPILAVRGLPAVENAFITTSLWQLVVCAFVSTLAVVLLGNTFVIVWQLADRRFGVRPLPLPLFEVGFGLRELSMTSGLGATLLLPLLWVFHHQATDCERPVAWAWLGLLLGVALCAGAVSVVAWWAGRARQSGPTWLHGLLDRLLRRLGPGYWDETANRPLEGHKMSAALAALLVGIYLLFYLLFSPEDARHLPSALSFLLLWVTLICLLLAGAAFWLDRWRVPLLLAIVAFASFMNGFFPRSHEFEVFSLDRISGSVPLDPEGLGTLTVVAADGGGIQAAAWSAHVLTGLQDLLGDRFSSSVRFISSVSGGSVGVFFYLEGAASDGSSGPQPTSRECVRAAAATSSLEATAWGLLGPDFRRLVFPLGLKNTRDRGWALERAFVHTAARMRAAIEGSRGSDGCGDLFGQVQRVRSDGTESRLSDWRRLARSGQLPGMAFNSTVVDNGEQAFFTTVDPATLGCRRGHPCDAFGHLDLRAATAARLSATFPYVSPIARAHLDGLSAEDRETVGKWSVADGGYFDNFGAFAAIQWLRHHAEDLAAAGVGKVVFLQILTFPETARLPPTGTDGLLYSTVGPLKTLLNVRTSSQLERTQVELKLLKRELSANGVSLEEPVELRPPWLPNHEAPLSWDLSEDNIKAIRKQWRLVCEAERERLQSIYGVEDTACPETS